jgi:hypothetical protein
MGMDLSYYSKNKIEKVLSKPIEKFLTEEGFYSDDKYMNKEYDDCYCDIGRSNCIDENICGWEKLEDFNANTIYTTFGNCFDKKVKFYNKYVLIILLKKIEAKMIRCGLDNEERFEVYRSYGRNHEFFKHMEEEYIFPFFINIVNCLKWLNELEDNDEIILIVI